MALTNQQAGAIRRIFYKNASKTRLKATGTLPNEAQFKAAWDILNDNWDTDRIVLKAAIDTALGRVLTAPQADDFTSAWMIWRALNP